MRIFILWLSALALLLAAGCGSLPAQTVQPPTASPSQPTAIHSPTAAPSPTVPPGRLILYMHSGTADPAITDWLSGQASQAGLNFETRDALTPTDLGNDARVVVFLETPDNLNDLLAAGSATQFLLISGDGHDPAANLSVARASPERMAFAAGFLSAVLSDDWRAVGLIPNDNPALQEAFLNGGRYYCGDCAPGWPLGEFFPQVSPTPANADGPTWAAEAQALFDSAKANVFYLSPEASRSEVYAALADKIQVDHEVVVLGSLDPPDQLINQWAATLTVDRLSALQQVLPDLLAGKGGAQVEIKPVLTHVNPANLSPGRQDLFTKMEQDLEGGLIQPGDVQ
jgi:hypothetical protein